MIEGLLDNYPDKYSFICLAGAIKHQNYSPLVVDQEKYGTNWVIQPVDGYGNPEIIRSAIRTEKPDLLWFMTDPRFFGWLWAMEDEIRPLMPMVYYHVWDNKPYPTYNKKYYESNDLVVTISKLTSDIVQNVSPDVKEIRHPHAVNPDIFKKIPKSDCEGVSAALYKQFPQNEEKIMFFWNNRNAKRKQSGSLIYWFKKFLDKVGHDKAFLMMHTEPRDPHGQPLDFLIKEWGLDDGQVVLSATKVNPEELAMMYNIADCTINIADAEGFGLSSLESLSCGTPVINTMTGGLQEQVTDGENWFGIGIEPASKSVIGSLDVPWIYEDRLSEEQVVASFEKMISMTSEEREELGRLGRQHVDSNYSFKSYVEGWDSILSETIEAHGSWENRKNHKSWSLEEVA